MPGHIGKWLGRAVSPIAAPSPGQRPGEGGCIDESVALCKSNHLYEGQRPVALRALMGYALVARGIFAQNNVVCEANVRHKSESLFCGENSLSYGVVPSRHIVLASSIRGLRPRLSSLRSVVPSRHLTLLNNKTYAEMYSTCKASQHATIACNHTLAKRQVPGRHHNV